MKVINAALLMLGVALACLPSSYAQQGVRGESAAARVGEEDAFEGEEEYALERLLEKTKTDERLKKRCPFPGELDRKYDLEEDGICEGGEPLFKMWKFCKKYCYVCPCWDKETYYDFNGELIENACSPEYCGKKDPELPCSKNKGVDYCCDCYMCKFLEILPSDHPLCEPDKPQRTCEDVTPKEDENGDFFCDADCPSGLGECVSDAKGNKCFCEKPCEDVEPSVDKNGDFFCDADCPGRGVCVPDARGRSCSCAEICEDVIPSVDKNGDFFCDADCPGRGSCVPDSEGESCSCKPDCEDANPDDGCDGVCPDDTSGESCVKDGDGGCTCSPPCEASSPLDGCFGTCPFTGQACVENDGECSCAVPCSEATVDDGCFGTCPFTGQACVENDGECSCAVPCSEASVDDDCFGICPFTGQSCVENDGVCTCGLPCDEVKPEPLEDGELVCNGFCPTDDGQACVPVDDDTCGCEKLCEFDEIAGGCEGLCPEDGQSCVEADGACLCAAPPVCSIQVDKKCVVPRAPAPAGGECDGKVTQLTLIWTGTTAVQVAGQRTDKSIVQPGEELTLFGPFDGNDQVLQLQGGGVGGSSTFHMSCSDDDMNGPEDCGKLQGNGKKSNEGINLWVLEALISEKGGGFDCNTSPIAPEEGQDECVLLSAIPPSCDTGKPDTITFLYNGGSNPLAQCASSTINQVPNAKGKFHTDFECSGQVNPSEAIVVQLDGASGTVQPNETFTVGLKSIKETTIANSGGSQSMQFHTSCSQPIQAGLTAGALTIVALDGQSISNQVSYVYEVTNTGDTVAEVTSVIDDQIGNIITSPFKLSPNETRRLDASDQITTTSTGQLTNVVEVTAVPEGGNDECTATDSVTVLIRPGSLLAASGKSKSSGGALVGFPGGIVIASDSGGS